MCWALRIDPIATEIDRRPGGRYARAAPAARSASAMRWPPQAYPGAYRGRTEVRHQREPDQPNAFRAFPGRGRATCAKRRDVFKRYLVAGQAGLCRAAIGRRCADAIDWIHAAGGQAVLAHPGRSSSMRDRRARAPGEFRDVGGDGIEVLSLEPYCRADRRIRAPRARYSAPRLVRAPTTTGRARARSIWATCRRCPPALTPVWKTGDSLGDWRRLSAKSDAGGETRRTAASVFFVSDRTGITAEMLGNSLLIAVRGDRVPARRTIPFVDTPGKDRRGRRDDQRPRRAERQRPLVFSSIVDEAMSAQLRREPTRCCSTCSRSFIAPLEAELGAKSLACRRPIARHRQQPRVLRADGGDQLRAGARRRRRDARSRQGAGDPGRRAPAAARRPTTLYLALQFGIRAANFPLTPDDFVDRKLPTSILPLPRPAVRPDDRARAAAARSARRAGPDSKYAALENCRYEVREARAADAARAHSDARYDSRRRSRRSPRRSSIAPGCSGILLILSSSSLATATAADIARRVSAAIRAALVKRVEAARVARRGSRRWSARRQRREQCVGRAHASSLRSSPRASTTGQSLPHSTRSGPKHLEHVRRRSAAAHRRSSPRPPRSRAPTACNARAATRERARSVAPMAASRRPRCRAWRSDRSPRPDRDGARASQQRASARRGFTSASKRKPSCGNAPSAGCTSARRIQSGSAQILQHRADAFQQRVAGPDARASPPHPRRPRSTQPTTPRTKPSLSRATSSRKRVSATGRRRLHQHGRFDLPTRAAAAGHVKREVAIDRRERRRRCSQP